MTIPENLQKYEKQIYFGISTATALACFPLAPVRTVAGVTFAAVATQRQHEHLPQAHQSYHATPYDAASHLFPALLTGVLVKMKEKPRLGPLPLLIGGLFGNLVVRNLYQVKQTPLEKLIELNNKRNDS